jgi:hypothetical protein
VVLVEEKMHRLMEQSRRYRNRSIQICPTNVYTGTLNSNLTLYIKTNLKRIVDLNVKHKTIKLLEKTKAGENLWNLQLGKVF